MQALRAQTVVVPVESVMGRVVAEVVGELDRTLQRRQRLATDLDELFNAHPFGRIPGTLPGIGPRTGSRILAEIGDGARFANGSRLASYAGLAPVTRQSGSSLRGEARSRRGNHRLKNAMFLAAFASLRDPASRAYYDRKRAEGKKHNAAVICLARRRCDVILAMLRLRQPYRSRHPRREEAAVWRPPHTSAHGREALDQEDRDTPRRVRSWLAGAGRRAPWSSAAPTGPGAWPAGPARRSSGSSTHPIPAPSSAGWRRTGTSRRTASTSPGPASGA